MRKAPVCGARLGCRGGPRQRGGGRGGRAKVRRGEGGRGRRVGRIIVAQGLQSTGCSSSTASSRARRDARTASADDDLGVRRRPSSMASRRRYHGTARLRDGGAAPPGANESGTPSDTISGSSTFATSHSSSSGTSSSLGDAEWPSCPAAAGATRRTIAVQREG